MKNFIEERKQMYLGKLVSFEGNIFLVVDIDANGMLMIDKPTYYCGTYTSTTTAVEPWQLD